MSAVNSNGTFRFFSVYFVPHAGPVFPEKGPFGGEGKEPWNWRGKLHAAAIPKTYKGWFFEAFCP
jgi:hypothetical protein